LSQVLEISQNSFIKHLYSPRIYKYIFENINISEEFAAYVKIAGISPDII